MIDILTHARWCNHCKDHVDLNTHHETCEFAALQKQNVKLKSAAVYAFAVLDKLDFEEANIAADTLKEAIWGVKE